MNLFFHHAALGDFVLSLPIIRGLAASGRTVVVSAWSKAHLASLLVRNVEPMDIEMWEFSRLFAIGGPTSVSPAVRELFDRSQCIVSFLSDGQDAWSANVARLAPRARRVYIQPRPPNDWPGHVRDWHASELKRQEVVLPDPPTPRFASPDGPVVVHPGSGGYAKCWPLERFEMVLQELTAEGHRVAPVLGEVELETWPQQTIQRWHQRHLAGILRSVADLHGVLRGASAFVGNDAGPTHLAAQMGLPTLALFGPTDPVRWAPIGPAVKVVAPRTPRPMDWLGVQEVLAALARPTRMAGV